MLKKSKRIKAQISLEVRKLYQAKQRKAKDKGCK